MWAWSTVWTHIITTELKWQQKVHDCRAWADIPNKRRMHANDNKPFPANDSRLSALTQAKRFSCVVDWFKHTCARESCTFFCQTQCNLLWEIATEVSFWRFWFRIHNLHVLLWFCQLSIPPLPTAVIAQNTKYCKTDTALKKSSTTFTAATPVAVTEIWLCSNEYVFRMFSPTEYTLSCPRLMAKNLLFHFFPCCQQKQKSNQPTFKTGQDKNCSR